MFHPTYRGGSDERGLLARFWAMLQVQWSLWRARSGLDAVYIRSHVGAFPTTLWLLTTGIPVVHEVNGSYEDLFIAWPVTRRISWLVQSIWRWQLASASRVLAVTPGLAQRVVIETRSRRVDCVPNGVNTDLFQPERAGAKVADQPYAVFVGKLTPWQGVDTVLRAIASPAWPEGVSLTIVGDGAERDAVAAAADGRRIVYYGRVPYKQVPAIMAGAAVSLSVQDNPHNRSATGLYPLKVYESMACGVPVIVSDFPGQADLVRSTGCGLIVPPGDPNALAGAVSEIIGDPALRASMGRRGRDAAVAEHSWDLRAGKVDGVLRELVAVARRRRHEVSGSVS